MGPIGAARVGYVNGEYILNPTDDQAKAVMDAVAPDFIQLHGSETPVSALVNCAVRQRQPG